MTKNTRSNDVVDILKSQHAEIRSAFRRAARPGPGRSRAFQQLVKLLAIHEAGEEAHVHPVARKLAAAGKAVASARRTEEKEAKQLLTELARIGPNGRGYRGTLRELRKAVLAHAAREEREEFPALLREVSRPRRWMLGLEVRLTQAVAPTRPHPAVNNELANKLATPVFGPLDRVRDLLHRPGAGNGTGVGRELLRRAAPSNGNGNGSLAVKAAKAVTAGKAGQRVAKAVTR
jgi:hemerythrin superfamily protein